MPVQLTREQALAVSDRDGGLLVSAAAGSGKTRVLVERLMSRVEEGADIDRFLVITYTKAAAAELHERIIAELHQRMSLRPGDAALRRQATLVYQTQVSTIDAFCTRLLREEGHRLELDHDFRVCDENEAGALMLDALGDVLDRRYETIAPGDDFAQLVDTMSAGRDDARLVNIVLDIHRRVQSHPAPRQWLDQQDTAFAMAGVTDVAQTVWGQLLLDDVCRQSRYWAGQMERMVALTDLDAGLSKGYAGSLQETRRGLLALAQAGETGWDAAVEAAGQVTFPKLGPVRDCAVPQAKQEIQTVRDRCKKRVEKLAALLCDGSEQLIEDMAAVYPAIRGLFALERDFDDAYTALKRRRGVLDFSDLEHLSAQLLLDGGEPSALARRWGERFDEVMVDEYQDTNAVQNAIFDAITAGGRNLFMVGDVKQSIYRFRLAEPGIFLEKYRAFDPAETADKGEPRRVLLSQNFRSRPQVLEGVNYVFRSVMSQAFGEMDYTADEELIPGGSFPETAGDARVELDLVECRQPDNAHRRSSGELEPLFVARRIRQLLDEGYPVTLDKEHTRPVECGDIVVLLRSRSSVILHYAAALEAQGIPWEAEGGADFFAATEIQVALSLLRLVDNPHQDVALIAVLRSVVYGFSADRLAQIRAAAGDADFYTALTRDGGEDVRNFLDELAQLRRYAGDESCADLIWRVYDRTSLLALFSALDDGDVRRDNLLQLAQLARDYEQQGHRGLFHFLLYLQQLEESGRSPSVSSAGGGKGVRIMTIHRSKGLEFPVVVLAGLAHGINKTDTTLPILFHPQLGVGPKRLDLERMVEYPTLARQAVGQKLQWETAAEELRLLYVAMTRAKDKLIMTYAGKRLGKELDKLLPFAGSPVEPQALLECTSPGQWVLLPALARPEAAPLREGWSPAVAPGTDFGPAWDIRMVELFEDAPKAKKTERPETAAGAGVEADPALVALLNWRYPHAGDVELPSKLTATQLKGRDLDAEAAQEATQPPRPAQFDRPHFATEKLGLTPAQKGTALHLVMQYIDFARCGSVEDIAAEIGRLEREAFITPQQAEAVEPGKLWQFFSAPLGRALCTSPTLRREFKFSVLVPAARYYPGAGEGEQVLLQGVVDCYFETGEGITVVDFKTDHVYGEALAERAEEYRPQLEAYAQALGEITGKRVAKKVLWFFSESRGVEL